MKRIIPITALIVVIFTSCEYEPYSDFSVDYDVVVPGEEVVFRNYSSEATHFEWDFGDGTYSTLANPSHYYTREGVYRVALAAYYGSYVDYSYMNIEVYATTLEIEVREYFTDELIQGVNVVIYPSEYEYDNFGYEVFRGRTDYYGSVIAKGLNSQSYYIDVYNDLYNNYTLAYEDMNFITTLPLEHASHNVFIAYVDYDPIGFKSTEDKARIREVKKVEKKRTLEARKELSK
jgi:hypothetical protein